MKVSKVDHVRTAISQQDLSMEDKGNIGGILYENPSRLIGDALNVKEHVDKLNQRAQGLYNVIAPTMDDATGVERTIIRNFNVIMKSLLKKNYYYEKATKSNILNKREVVIKKQMSMFWNFLTYKFSVKKPGTKEYEEKLGTQLCITVTDKCTIEDIQKSVQNIVTKNLRGSLRKHVNIKEGEEDVLIYLPDVIAQLMYAFCLGKNGYVNEYKKIDKVVMETFLHILNEDYTKEKEINHIVKSIQCKNVKVQPDSNGFLQLTSAEHVDENRDHKSKKYIFEFIKRYANENDKNRKKMLLHMRKLIVFYLYGKEKYNAESTKVSLWSFGELEKDNELYFSEDAKEILKVREGWDELEHDKKNNEIEAAIRKETCRRYCWIFKGIKNNGNVYKDMKLEPEDYFWLNWITDEVEHILYKRKYMKEHQLKLSYLSRHIWDAWMSFIAMKFIDMGKAVYHFAVPDIANLNTENPIVIGKVLDVFKDGLTSFDYERIKADETIERELNTYITFAINTFTQAVVPTDIRQKEENEDILFGHFRGSEEIRKKTFDAPEAIMRMLQYFGGKSKWATSDNEIIKACIKESKSTDFIKGMQGALRIVRNASVHYTAESKNHYVDEGRLGILKSGIIKALYDEEVSGLDKLYCEKYASNNTLMFFDVENITTLMLMLYNKNDSDIKRMPAFKNIISRQNMSEFIGTLLKNHNDFKDVEIKQRFEATLYFLLEEIYYHSFVHESSNRSLFEKGLKELEEEYKKEDKKMQNALRNFQKRVKDILEQNSSCTLEKLCEVIMTDYNMQNNMKEKIASRDTNKKADQISYKHFPILLRQCMRNAFVKYVMNCDTYKFIWKPKYTNISEGTDKELYKSKIVELYEKVCNGKKHTMVPLFTDEELDDERILAWYATAHFLSPKYLNQLNGAMLSYIQTIEDVAERAKRNGVETKPYQKEKEYYGKVTRMIGLVRNYAGRITQEFQDYFMGDEVEAAEAYAKYLSRYVDFSQYVKYIKDMKDQLSDASNPMTLALRSFEEQIKKYRPEERSGGIYYDEQNPIINKKVIHTMLYGNVKSVDGSIQKVTEEDLCKFYRLYKKESVAAIRNGNPCTTEEQQKEYKKYQNQKNRVELLDVRILGEIVNDLTAKMISWSYLRERDLLYFQLGVQYIRLYHPLAENEIDKEDLRRRIYKENVVNIQDGGILYQLIAMNTYGMPMFVIDKSGELKAEESNKGYDYGSFTKAYSKREYVECLEIFEETSKQHDKATESRNYFDHFKYFSRADRSIMEMYSDIYKTFFSYDSKLKKSIFYIMADILKGYFVIIGTRVFMDNGQDVQKESDKRERYQIGLKDRIESDVLTYKVNKKPVQVYARSTMFLEQVRNVLLYKEGKEAKDE